MSVSSYWESKSPLWTPVKLSTVNKRCGFLWSDLVENAELYGIRLRTMECGAQLMDFGVHCPGSLEAGRIATELCQGGLAKASLSTAMVGNTVLPEITCETRHPGAGCLDMQMGLAFDNALLSGPYRLFVEPLRFVVDDIPLTSAKDAMVALIEPYQGAPEFSDKDAIHLAEMGNSDPKDLKIMLIPGPSLAGSTQVCGRAVEDVILTIHRSLLVDCSKVLSIIGKSPVCPHYDDTPGTVRLDNDDFLHYISECFLAYYSEEGEDIQKLVDNLVFNSVDLYGQYWGDIMDSVGGDFFKIPNITDINKIGAVTINDVRTGKIYAAGKKRYDIIEARL
jgi:methenyltetrahydromethanopterin cyclohydrolase